MFPAQWVDEAAALESTNKGCGQHHWIFPATRLTPLLDPLRHQPARRLQVPFKQHLDVSSCPSIAHATFADPAPASSVRPRSRTSTPRLRLPPPSSLLRPRPHPTTTPATTTATRPARARARLSRTRRTRRRRRRMTMRRLTTLALRPRTSSSSCSRPAFRGRRPSRPSRRTTTIS